MTPAAIEAARALLACCAESRRQFARLQYVRTAGVHADIAAAYAAQTSAECVLARLLPELPAKPRTAAPVKVRVGGPSGARSEG